MCLMTPQSPFVEASVSYTKPYFGIVKDEPEFITDALLILTDVEQNIRDTFIHNQEGMYQLILKKFSLKEFRIYTLEVILKSGQSYRATAQVPPKPDFNKFHIDNVAFGKPYLDLNGGGWGQFYINPFVVEFSYDLKEKGFYVSPHLEGMATSTIGTQIPTRISFADEIQPFNTQKRVRFFTQSELYSDQEADYSMEVFTGAIYTMDKAYRDFYIMQQKQEADNPFSEPVMFTNNFSSGALGVFGCYDFITGTAIYKK